MSFRLRSAKFEDAKQVFDWRNDPWIVSLSRNQQVVSWEEHILWFPKILNENQHLLLIIQSEFGPEMGSVRFDRENDFQAVVTIYLLYPFVGKGIGVLALIEANSLAFKQWSELRCIHAFIRMNNLRSIRGFSKAGFQSVHNNSAQHQEQIEMVLFRETVK